MRHERALDIPEAIRVLLVPLEAKFHTRKGVGVLGIFFRLRGYWDDRVRRLEVSALAVRGVSGSRVEYTGLGTPWTPWILGQVQSYAGPSCVVFKVELGQAG